MTPPRFTVPDSIRAYESIYIRSHTHPGRAQGDSKNIFKTKGWRFKDEAWIYDVGWKITPCMFTPNLGARKFVVQAEVKIMDAIVKSEEKQLHVMNFTSERDMGLVPFPERLVAEATT
jgi:hypothetical protein